MSDIGAFNTGTVIEVETGLSLFGTGDSWEFATVSETVADQSIEFGGGGGSIVSKLVLTYKVRTN